MNPLVQNQNPNPNQNQNQYSNPFTYHANTHRSIEKRKHKASTPSSMKILNIIQNDDGSFIVYIKGNRGIYYQVFFSEQEITCSCPDFQKHTVKPICKHMFKLICLSENHDIFNNSMLLTDLTNPQYLGRIFENILRIIDIKKMERYGSQMNRISIQRDESCPICYGDFDTDIAECSKCKHVFHKNCLSLSWNSASYNSRGKCPMCRESNSFPTLGGNNNHDAWEIYNFPQPMEEEQIHPVAEEPQPMEEESPAEENNQNTPPFPSITNQSSEESDASLLEEDEFALIDRRIKILNISVFILETVNIIINYILYPSEQPE